MNFISVIRHLGKGLVPRQQPVIIPRKCSSYSMRSHTCGELRQGHVGTRVTLAGWLQSTRLDKFLLLRDRSGLCQVKIPEDSIEFDHVKNLPNESVLVINGTVKNRPEGQTNLKMDTGDIEIELEAVIDVSKADPNPPFQQSKHRSVNEHLRLQYRYLDLRRPDLQHNLEVRSDLMMMMREFLISKRFLDIETPTMFRRTPGGAKEFVVPTHTRDKFYSLVQSPQQFKQLLMVGGLDRYFQVARCYRDEGGKPDRQPEFTQLDIEMSFASRRDIINLIEDLLVHCWPRKVQTPIEQMVYEDAMSFYGVDKPDLRFENKILNLTETLINSGFDFIDSKSGNPLFYSGAVLFDSATEKSSHKILKSVENEVKKIFEDQLEECKKNNKPIIISSVSKKGGIIHNTIIKKVNEDTRDRVDKIISDNKMGFIVCGDKEAVLPILGKLRNLLAKELIPDLEERPDKFLWVVDFPLFLMEDGVLESAHHPFTACHPEDRHMFRSRPLECRSLHYDLVLNGQEVGGGSVRIHSMEDQMFVLDDVLKADVSELKHLLEALNSGCPPHAGIALGLDRLVAILTKSSSIRDVIAFPKSAEGKDVMSESRDQRLAMSSSKARAEKERERQVQDKVQAILGAMLKDEDNKYCVDCDSKGPRWASWNLGVFLCIRCAGIHRNLGVHISRVKSVNLDSWTPHQVASMTVMGNSKGRAVYEANLPNDYRRPTSDQAMEAFIRQKYEKKKYIAAEWTNPKPPDFPANWDTAGTAAQEIKKPEFKKLNIPSNKPSPSPQAPATVKATASPKPQTPASKPVATVAKPSTGLVKSSSTLDSDLLGLSLGSPSTASSTGASVPSSASSNDLLGLNSEFGDFVSTSPNPASAPTSRVTETSPAQESSAQAGQEGKMSNSSILALFGPKISPAPAAAGPAQAQASSMFGALPTKQPPQQQFGGLGGMQMTSFGAAPQQQQQQFGGFSQQQQTQQQQLGQFQAMNPAQQQNFGASLMGQPPAFNIAPSSQQNNMFDMFSSKPGQINNNQTPANNPFLETNQVNGLGNLGTVPTPSLWQ